jgi:hypothetical protein
MPTLGLKPTMPLTLAGQVIEPLVSVPIAPHAKPAAIAAPLPEDEPQALRSIAWGLRVSPPIALHPLVESLERILAHSERFALPSTTPPAARRLAISGASRRVALPASAMLPAVVGHSLVSTLSFTTTLRPLRMPLSAIWRALNPAVAEWTINARIPSGPRSCASIRAILSAISAAASKAAGSSLANAAQGTSRSESAVMRRTESMAASWWLCFVTQAPNQSTLCRFCARQFTGLKVNALEIACPPPT